MKAVIDTCTIIDGLIRGYKEPKYIIQKLKKGDFNLLMTDEMAKELNIAVYMIIEKAKNSPKQKVQFNPKKYLRAVSVFSLNATKVKTHTKITSCNDPEDNMILECAIDGKADYCISSDSSIYDFKNYSDNEIELEWVKDIKIFHPIQYVLHEQKQHVKTTGA